jgi:hypothetical protein
MLEVTVAAAAAEARTSVNMAITLTPTVLRLSFIDTGDTSPLDS